MPLVQPPDNVKKLAACNTSHTFQIFKTGNQVLFIRLTSTDSKFRTKRRSS